MFKKLFYVGMLLSGIVFAEPGRPGGPGGPGHGGGHGHGGGFSLTSDLDASLNDIASQVDYLPPQLQEIALQSLLGSDAKLHSIIARLESCRGKWVQTNSVDCTTVCRGLGLNNAPSPEGALCVSGEQRVASANGKISYTHGTWGTGCVGTAPGQCPQSSVGAFCYAPGQKRDNDRTDRTVGCFCRR